MPEPGEMTVTVTVVQAGKPDMLLKCSGKNLRNETNETGMKCIQL